MTNERGMTIYFMDGSNMAVTFPKQVKSEEIVSVRLEQMLDKPALMIEADGALLMLPFSSIKYVQVYPAPPRLPDYVIKDAAVTG